MEIRFFEPTETDRNIKCSIQKSGYLNFATPAAKKLDLDKEKSIRLGMNDEDKDDPNLYMIVEDSRGEGAFRIRKAGQYFYINTKAVFDTMGLDYRNKVIQFHIVDCEDEEGQPVLKLVKWEKDRKQKVDTSD